MRLLLLVAALWAAVLPASACDALILIQGSRAGEPAAGLGVRQPTWVLWPYSAPPHSANELISVTSGLDWYGDLDLLSFTSGGVRRWRSLAGQTLARRGYFKAREAFLQGWPVELLSNAPDTVSQPALVLALDGTSPWITVLPFHSKLPSNGLIVYDARGWDDATAVARRCGGRAMVVEYPQGAWSRFWLYGRGWPEGPWVPTDAALGEPGLIEASHLLSLVRSPSAFASGALPGPYWRGADQWLERASGVSPIAEGAMYAILALAIFAVLWRINIERNARTAKTALCLASLLPAADLIAGNVARWVGFGWWWPALCLTWAAGLGISSLVCRRQLLLGCSLVGVLICAVANPLWSDFSAVLGSRQLSPEGLGLMLAYTAAFSSLAVEQGRAWIWISRALCFGLLVYGAFGNAWWCFGSPAMVLVPAIGWLSGEGLMGWELLGLTAVAGFVFSGLPDSLVWTPHGLLYNLSDRSGYDVSPWVLFLGSPGFLGTLSLFGGFVIYTAGFVAYRLGRAIREHPAFGSSSQSLGGMLALCVSTPAMLTALIPAIFGVLAVLAYGAGED